MKKNNYDFIASYYIFIRYIIFGTRTEKAYKFHLQYIKPTDSALIVGGGAGKILSDTHLSVSTLRIDYLDSSQKMIDLARKRKCNAEVNFICEDVLNFKPGKKYDVIILPFILDVFSEPNLLKVIDFAEKNIAEGGLLIVIDFAPPATTFQKILLRVMFIFFKVFTNIESKNLLLIEDYLKRPSFTKITRADFSKGFIFSAVFKEIKNNALTNIN